MGTNEDLYPTFMSLLLNEDESNNTIGLLFKFKDYFTWSYIEMIGLAPKITAHKIGVLPEVNHSKHEPRCMHQEIKQ